MLSLAAGPGSALYIGAPFNAALTFGGFSVSPAGGFDVAYARLNGATGSVDFLRRAGMYVFAFGC